MIQIQTKQTGKQYWRSLGELSHTGEFKDWLHREFPANASEMLEGTSRRNLLKLMAASMGLAGLTACRRPVEKILPNVRGVEDYIPGKPFFYSTVFTQGGSATGLLVEVNDGRPTKIEGNPDHPYSLGAANGYQQASVLGLYDPDRARQPISGGTASDWKAFDDFSKTQNFGQGEGLRFLSDRICSPSLLAVKTVALAKYPGAKWVEYNALAHDDSAAGGQLAFGQPVVTRHKFDKATVILSLDDDFLGLDSNTVLSQKEFSRGRRIASTTDEMNRLYMVESQYSVTGAMADHRLRMRSSDVKGFVADLANELKAGGNELQVIGSGNRDEKRARWMKAVAKDLSEHNGKSLVVAGPRQPAAVHAMAHVINQVLGNAGETVVYFKSQSDAFPPQIDTLKELAGEMAGGKVSTLVILGGNPAFTAPADLEFIANLKKVPLSIYLGLEVDETAIASKWSLPEAHYLESWGDAMSPDGTATVQQPMIQPLYFGRTAAELVAQLTGYKDTRSYDIVRNYWIAKFAGKPEESEKTWRKSLHDGVIAAPAAVEIKPVLDAKKVNSAIQAPDPAKGSDTLEIVFVPSASVYDGRYANNGWLQEAPEPMTKLTWDNAALVSPATAKRLGLAQGDTITIDRAGRGLEAPVLIQPGQADDSISIALGYGRTAVGRVGKNVGVNAYRIRTTEAFGFAGDARIRKTGNTYPLAQTQEHHSMEGRPLVREASLEEYRKEPKFVDEMVEHPPLVGLYPDWDYSKGYQWGMSIDLNVCSGCNACVIACQSENNIPIVGKDQVIKGREMHWIRMDRYYNGNEEDPQVVTQPVTCMQCETAPCENVCPVAATTHSPEGLNDMAYNRCVGTRYCSNNCPYKVRRFNFLAWNYGTEEVQKMHYNPNVTVRMRGVMEKCTYCVQRIQEKKILAKREGHRAIKDGEIVPACAQTCPADAIVFGNINDPQSKVAKLKAQSRNYSMLEELNTKPRTTYLAKLRNPNEELEAKHG